MGTRLQLFRLQLGRGRLQSFDCRELRRCPFWPEYFEALNCLRISSPVTFFSVKSTMPRVKSTRSLRLTSALRQVTPERIWLRPVVMAAGGGPAQHPPVFC